MITIFIGSTYYLYNLKVCYLVKFANNTLRDYYSAIMLLSKHYYLKEVIF